MRDWQIDGWAAERREQRKEVKNVRSTRVKRAIVVGLAALLLGASTVYAATSVTIAAGNIAHFEPFGGPATMTTRTLLIEPNEVLGWHVHPGIGAYTIVKAGTLTVEDGCGGTTVYQAGSAFVEHPGRIHRGIAGNARVETVQTFVVPQGSAFSMPVPQGGCGEPLAVEECDGGGWSAFTYPRTFANQGDCVQYVIHGGDR